MLICHYTLSVDKSPSDLDESALGPSRQRAKEKDGSPGIWSSARSILVSNRSTFERLTVLI